MAWLFMVGAFLFALGSFPPYAQKVDPGAVGLTFVAGSVFFTSAAAAQLTQTVRDRGDRRLVWACAVQLVGTVLFNLNTFDAARDSLDTEETNRLVWAPDFFGSIAFLVASHLAWVVVCRRLWCVRPDDAEWWVAALNYVGSIFFMASALASFTLSTTGEAVNTTIVNTGTFLGAVGFLLGAYLLLPAEDDVPVGAGLTSP
ncbi:MAG: hypothetical protein ABWZ52_12275 [Acidimicrobiales bacterium]